MTKTVASPAEYLAAFDAERAREYPVVDAFETRCGYWVDVDVDFRTAEQTSPLEDAARTLACPVKDNPPNWQHGRVLYAWTREYLATRSEPILLLDVGTAKGYSALCLQWALQDSSCHGAVVSVDVLDPNGNETRNSVLECDGPKTLAQFLAPWPEAQRITFLKSTGIDWLKKHPARVNLAFIDGKHSGAVVAEEGRLLSARQVSGDRVMFDDVQIAGVGAAVVSLSTFYKIEYVFPATNRAYALGVRR